MQKNANETAKETKNMFLQSAKELKAVTTLAACAMFAALAMILNFYVWMLLLSQKTDHQTCACSQVHRYADCQRTAEHPVDQHAVWKRNHGASSGTCLKEPDYVADRFHHFL